MQNKLTVNVYVVVPGATSYCRAKEREEREEERKTLRKVFLPGICFTVVLSGYNVLKQFTSSHPKTQETSSPWLFANSNRIPVLVQVSSSSSVSMETRIFRKDCMILGRH